MSDKRRAQIRNNLIFKETEELLEIWQNENVDEWDDEVFEIAWEIIQERLGYVPPQSVQKQAAQFLSNVDRYLEAGEFDKALGECELAVKMAPDLAMAYYYRGQVYDEMGQLEPAVEAYLKAIQLNPRFYAARDNLGNARVRLEEEQYHRVAMESQIETQEEDETAIEWDEAQVAEILETDHPIPGWSYLDEKSFLLTGWPGHRTRQGRSGYDPLDTDFEEAHMEGVIIRKLITRKFRTRNPIFLFLMTFVGLLYCIPLLGVITLLQGYWIAILPTILSFPVLIVGIALLNNVLFSLLLEDEPYEDEEKGYTFF
jgi:tetratricopeptide (TPR) repeat protein